MTRFMAAAYALATVLAWTSVPAEPGPEVNVVVVSEAPTRVAAVHAAWERANAALDDACQELGTHAADSTGGTEQAAPTADGAWSAEVFAGGICR